MEEFLTSGRALDFVLVVVALEVVALLAWGRRVGAGFGPVDLLGQLLAGAMLLLAVRAAVTQAPWYWTALFLALSFPAHLFDLSRRWRTLSEARRTTAREP